MEIVRINGRWTVNGRRYRYMTRTEKEQLSKFMVFMKEAYESNQKSKDNGKTKIYC